ncbi:MAG: PhnD/SsuA/transferrin family substrate-binding protein [Actinomycetota bacterium]|nr:PhnD/SsuA/transferrin family substrate-binding protein [Actinomycetota bacterium]
MRKSPLIVLLLAFAMLIAACASTGDEETTTAAAAAEETTTTAAAAEETTTTAAAAEETTTTAADPKADWPEEILFGFIPSEKQEKLADTVQPYMDYLTEELGITFEGVITADYNGLVVAMGAGNADLGAFGPFGYIQAQEQYPEIGVLIQSIRFGSDLYHGQWFTNDASICEDEPVVGAYEWVDGVPTIMDPTEVPALQVGWAYNDGVLGPEVLEDGRAVAQGLVCTAPLEAVVGKSIAFTSATSTSGGVFPQLQLFNLGIDIEEDLEYSYLTSHDATVAAVYNGDFDIGLSFDDARRTLRKEKTDVGEKVIVFNVTDDIPNDVVAVRGGLPESLQLAIFDATKAYLDTEEGEAIFDEIYGWTDIRLARDEDFDVVREAAVKLGVAEE